MLEFNFRPSTDRNKTSGSKYLDLVDQVEEEPLLYQELLCLLAASDQLGMSSLV